MKYAVDPVVRFWKFVDKSNENGCWNWTGTKNRGLYGHFQYEGKPFRAHRFSWYLATGRNPPDVLHKCHNAGCVNPAHLYEGTKSDNENDKHSSAARHKRFTEGR